MEGFKRPEWVVGREGQDLQSNSFCVVNYLICTPCIGTLFLSTSVSALLRWWEMNPNIKQLLAKYFLLCFEVCPSPPLSLKSEFPSLVYWL